MIRKLLINLAKLSKECTTLTTKKPNWITKVGETGLHVETLSSREKYSRGEKSSPYYYISYDFLMDAWQEFILAKNASQDDFVRTQGRSSFIMAFFHELPFVEKSEKDNKTSIKLKEFTTDQLPEANLQQVLALLDEIINDNLDPKEISNKYTEDSVKRLKSRARQGLKIIGFLTDNYEVNNALIQEYKETEHKTDFLAKQIKKHPYLSVIYQLLSFINDVNKAEKLSFLSEIGQLLVRNSMGSNQMVDSVAEYRTRNILNWFKETGLVDEEWNIVKEEKFSPLLLKVMYEFLNARQGPFSNHPLGDLLRRKIPSVLRELPFINNNYEVSGSIGKGNWTTVPWIAIMNRKITISTQRGYYIVYLFSDDMKRLYLTFAQGVTETPKEEMVRINEDIRASIQMSSKVYKDNNLDLGKTKKARDYAESVAAYIPYYMEDFPSEGQLLKDLEEMMMYYEQYIALKEYHINTGTDTVVENKTEMLSINEIITHINTYITSKGFYYALEEVQNLYLSLRTKPFIILSGISGTGKTMIVKWLAESVGATKENGQFTLIPVRPDWNDSSDLLGYLDIKGEFKKGPLAEVLLKAQRNPDKPYFILLDEMNLARVEYYFSDVLSVMESRELTENGLQSLPLIKEEIAGEAVAFPANVYIIGTVNMDETTYPFSKKVLDRANTIEFNEVNLENLTFLHQRLSVEPVNLSNHSFVSSYVHLKDVYVLHADVVEKATRELVAINNILKPIGAHVGYRVRDEISFYLAYNKQESVMSDAQALDRCILQKILPRISGSDTRVERVLVGLYKLFTKKDVPHDIEIDDEDLQLSKYPRSTAKVIEMLRRLRDDGFTSFWIN